MSNTRMVPDFSHRCRYFTIIFKSIQARRGHNLLVFYISDNSSAFKVSDTAAPFES